MERIVDGAVWPGWETVRLIGRGSFGTVYEIERDVFGDKEKAALKVISIPQSSSDIDELYSEGYDRESITNTFHSYLKSIVAEYSLMRKMNGSANVVNCDDVRYVQHDDGIGWDILIKMELLTPLTKALGRTVSDEQAVRIGSDICKALVLCKKHHIIHRDIKPANIFVSENGDYKLGDFGIAKTLEKTSGGKKIGTYEFMAPEVFNNRPYGVGADIYSLGMVLYWLLNERRAPFMPLSPEFPSLSDTRMRRFNGAEIPAPAHGSAELQRIVLKACAYEPEKRYQSAEEMLRELEDLSNDARSAKPQEDRTAAPQPAPALANIPSAEDPDETVRVIHASEPRQGRDFQAQMPPVPAAEKSRSKSKKGLIFGALGGLMLLAAVLLIVFLPKGGNVDTDEPSRHRESSSRTEKAAVTEANTPEPAEKTAEPTEEAAEQPVEEAYEPVIEPEITAYAKYMAAAVDDPVTILACVQATQSWWNDQITVYAADPDGAYFIYNMACSEEDAAKLVPGQWILVNGFKSEWIGEVEITDATFEFVDSTPYIAEPVDATAAWGTVDMINYMNQLVLFKGVTVEAYDESGAAFAYKNPEGKTDDLYFKVSKDGTSYEFCVEFYLCGNDTDVYKAVENLKVGDVIDLEGFLYWYEGPILQATAVK